MATTFDFGALLSPQGTSKFPTTPATIAVLSLSGIAAVLSYRKLSKLRGRKGLPLPPGPPGLPVIGNALDVPREEFWWKYKEWGDTYGSDVIYLNILGTDVVVLNSLAACKELLEKRSAIYSSGPSMPMMNDFIGFDWNFGFLPYGEAWKQRRKVFAKALGPKEIEGLRPTLMKVVRRFLLQVLDDPVNFREHTRLLSGSFILDIAYGLEVTSQDDVYITHAEKGMAAMAAAGTGTSYIVDLLPSMKVLPGWLPGVHFKKDAEAWRPHVLAMAREPLRFVEDGMKSGNARVCLATELLQGIEEGGEGYEEKRKVVHDVLASIYAAGSDTTVSSITTFFLAMAQYPHIQAKAQAVVDAALADQGNSRLPDFTEFKQLPYIDALVREILRWRPVTPISVPHAVTQDDVYKGYHIPKGATVISNCYAIAHDPEIYGKDTHLFEPGRFMNEEQTEVREDAPMGYETFGYGRRVCPGILSAVETIWLVVVSVLAAFDVRRVEEDGKGGEGGQGTFGKYTSGMLIHPVPFEVRIVPRSKEAEGLVRSGVLAL